MLLARLFVPRRLVRHAIRASVKLSIKSWSRSNSFERSAPLSMRGAVSPNPALERGCMQASPTPEDRVVVEAYHRDDAARPPATYWAEEPRLALIAKGEDLARPFPAARLVRRGAVRSGSRESLG